MIQNRSFLTSELPYRKLKKLGISEEKMLTGPPRTMERLLKGHLSPLMKLSYTNKKGEAKIIFLKLQLERMADGKVDLKVYPRKKDIREGNTYKSFHLTKSEEEALKRGEVVTKKVMSKGKHSINFIQLDRETNHLLYTKTKNLVVPNSLNDIELSLDQKRRIKEGKPVELSIGETKITAGVDLQNIQGFKVMKGDLNEWKHQKELKWDAANPDKMGFLQTDENRAEYQDSLDKQRSQNSKKTKSMKL